MTHIDIITAIKLIRQATNTEVREVLNQAIVEIEQLRNLTAAGLELAITVIEGRDAQELCQAIIKEAQR